MYARAERERLQETLALTKRLIESGQWDANALFNLLQVQQQLAAAIAAEFQAIADLQLVPGPAGVREGDDPAVQQRVGRARARCRRGAEEGGRPLQGPGRGDQVAGAVERRVRDAGAEQGPVGQGVPGRGQPVGGQPAGLPPLPAGQPAPAAPAPDKPMLPAPKPLPVAPPPSGPVTAVPAVGGPGSAVPTLTIPTDVVAPTFTPTGTVQLPKRPPVSRPPPRAGVGCAGEVSGRDRCSIGGPSDD